MKQIDPRIIVNHEDVDHVIASLEQGTKRFDWARLFSANGKHALSRTASLKNDHFQTETIIPD